MGMLGKIKTVLDCKIIILVIYSGLLLQIVDTTFLNGKQAIVKIPSCKKFGEIEAPSVIATDNFVAVLSGPPSYEFSKDQWKTGGALYIYGQNSCQELNVAGLPKQVAQQLMTSSNIRLPYKGAGPSPIVFFDNYIAVWGLPSFGSRSPRGETNEGWIFNAAENKWQSMPTANAPEPRYAHWIIPINHGFFIFGGWSKAKIDWPPKPLFSENNIKYASLSSDKLYSPGFVNMGQPFFDGAIYDIGSRQWTKVKGPEGWLVLNAIAWQQKSVFLMRNEKNNEKKVFLFDSETLSWSQIIALPEDMSFLNLVMPVGNNILTISGKYGDKCTMYLLDIQKKSWRKLSDPPCQMTGYRTPSAGYLNDSIILFDGKLYTSGSENENRGTGYEAWKYNLSTSRWYRIGIPEAVPFWTERVAYYLPQKKEYLIISTGTPNIEGLFWSPEIYEEEPFHLDDLRRGNYGIYWTGEFLVGIECYPSRLCHGFIYDPVNTKWRKIPSNDSLVDIRFFSIAGHKHNIVLLDGENGKVHILEPHRLKWEDFKISIPPLNTWFKIFDANNGIFIIRDKPLWFLDLNGENKIQQLYYPSDNCRNTYVSCTLINAISGMYRVVVNNSESYETKEYVIEKFRPEIGAFKIIFRKQIDSNYINHHMMVKQIGKGKILFLLRSRDNEKELPIMSLYDINTGALIEIPQNPEITKFDYEGVISYDHGLVMINDKKVWIYPFKDKKWSIAGYAYEILSEYSWYAEKIASFGDYIWIVSRSDEPIDKILEINLLRRTSRIISSDAIPHN